MKINLKKINLSKINITFTKKRIIWSSILCLISLLIVALNHKLYIIDNKFNIPLFVLSLVLPVFSSCLFAVKFNFTEKTSKRIAIVVTLISILLSFIIIELLNKNAIFVPFKRMLLNFIIIIFLYLLVYTITNKTKTTILTASSILFALGLVNYTVISFRGTPFVPWDVLSFRTAVSVAGAYTFTPTFHLFVAILCFIFLISLVRKVHYKFKVTRTNIIVRFALLTSIIVFTSTFYKTDVINFFDLDTNLWRPLKEYSNNGFLASFVKQSKNLFNEKPENYSISKVKSIINKYTVQEEPIEDDEIILEDPDYEDLEDVEDIIDTPHIIVIMNESFSDLSVNGDFGTSADYIPYYRNLKENTIKGYSYVSIFGGQTPNSEWEFLTNNSMAFMPFRTVPYQQYIHSRSPSLAGILKSQGYSAYGVHPWYGSGYRRNAIYPLLGFESFDSLETLKNLEYVRDYPTDLSTYEYVIKQFENRNPDKKFFNFTVTMQNHSGYDKKDYESTIFLTDLDNCPKVEQYLSIIKEADDALKYLIEYFSSVEEDVIILFFGDHQPPYLEEEFWDMLLDLEDEDQKAISQYLVPFTLWANYDIEEQVVEYTSLNYLSMLLLDTAGLKTTPYMEFLRVIQEQIPVITGNGYMDYLGNFYSLDEETEFSSIIREYQILQYNNVFDSRNRVNEVFTIKK